MGDEEIWPVAIGTNGIVHMGAPGWWIRLTPGQARALAAKLEVQADASEGKATKRAS